MELGETDVHGEEQGWEAEEISPDVGCSCFGELVRKAPVTVPEWLLWALPPENSPNLLHSDNRSPEILRGQKGWRWKRGGGRGNCLCAGVQPPVGTWSPQEELWGCLCLSAPPLPLPTPQPASCNLVEEHGAGTGEVAKPPLLGCLK